ncbi:hypothetical protein Tco_1517094 [Tanacetum coccineum]
MDNPNITMEEYIQLMADKDHKRGQMFDWKSATYGMIYDDIDLFKDFEADFPAIVYNDALASNHGGKGLFGPNGGRCGKVEVGFDDFGGGGEEIGNCGGNGRRGRSIFGRGGGSLAICSMESKDGLGGGGLVVVGGRSSRVSKRAWEEVGGVENKSSMGSMLIAKGEECLDGRVGASGGEVKGCGVDFGVTKSLLVEILGESDGEELVVVDEGAF